MRTPVCTTTSTRRRSFPPLIQRALERYTNLFGIIIWRVFSVDLVNFFIRVWREPREGGARVPVSRLGAWPRFNHVGEMICLTSLFTTLKYYPSNDAIFRERLLRYARTVPRAAGDRSCLNTSAWSGGETHFDWVTVAHYRGGRRCRHRDRAARRQVVFTACRPRRVPRSRRALPGSYAPAGR